jgi:hypothetical protein
MSKYDPLHDFLAGMDPDTREITMGFNEVESIIGFILPQSAHKYREWWANPSSPNDHPHAQSWLAAGWKVETVNQNEKWVRFGRD